MPANRLEDLEAVAQGIEAQQRLDDIDEAAAMGVFRLMWDRLDPARRGRLRAALAKLVEAQDELVRVTDNLLNAPNVAVNTWGAGFEIGFSPGRADRTPYREAADLAGEPYLVPQSMLEAAAAWDAGREYDPAADTLVALGRVAIPEADAFGPGPAGG